MAARPTTDNLPGKEPLHADGRMHAPAAGRNAEVIATALGPVLTGLAGTVLEIGSGTGQHAAHLAGRFPELDWQPSDAVAEHLVSIRAWVAHAGHANLRAPVELDATAEWPVAGPLAGVMAVNVIHIAPWTVAEAIVAGAGARVREGGRLVFYGPFSRGGVHNAESNAAFDASLRARDPRWGVRDLDDVAGLAAAVGFGAPEVAELPANNRLVAFRRL